MSLIHLLQVEIRENHVPQNPPSALNKCFRCGQVGCSGSIPICGQCLKDTRTELSTEPTLPEDTQTEWDDLCARLEEVCFTSGTDNSRRNTPVEPKKVNLQYSPSPPPAVLLPQIRDPGPGPQASEGDGVLVGFMGDNKHHDIARHAASVPLASPGEETTVEDFFDEFTWINNEGKDDADKKKEIATMVQVNREKWRQAIARRVVYLWTALKNLIFPSNIPQKHIKIDDEERQLSDQYYSFPHRPRSRLIPILKMLLLTLLLLAYLITDHALDRGHQPNDACSEEW